MSVQRHTVPLSEEDLESTAELPVLDLTAFEDKSGTEHAGETSSWPAPPATRPSADNEYALQRARLEGDLKSLSTTLRDVEERLALKGERLIELERELETARVERAQAEQRANMASAELVSTTHALAAAQAQIDELMRALQARDEAETARRGREAALQQEIAARDATVTRLQQELRHMEQRVGSYVELLQSLESRRGVFDAMLRGLQGDVYDRDGRISRLEAESFKQTRYIAEVELELASRAERLTALQKDVNRLTNSLAKSNNDTGALERSNVDLRQQIAAMSVAISHKDDLIRKLETTASEQAKEHSSAVAAAENLRRDLETAQARQLQALEALRQELDGANRQLQDRTQALQQLEAQQADISRQLQIAQTRVRELEAQATDHTEAMRQLHDELRTFRERNETAHADLRAAEEAVNRLEAELRQKTASLEELARMQEEWRSTVDAARQTLDERESLIRTLETEAANSAVLLDNIQQSMKLLDAGEEKEPEAASDGATRLLIRSDGETEVVHVLGRKTTIGRTPDNDLQIDTKFVSRHHAVILAGPLHTLVEDMNSTNGVLVNNRRVTRQTLKDGDTISIGKAHFRYAVRQSAERR